mmetsp:Transcript_12443/g.14320  ORF Transcript_12443/g.14320 Transcript_12443/m.14320 type:complete len:227 (-) Transcript_12443:912-1592(-)
MPTGTATASPQTQRSRQPERSRGRAARHTRSRRRPPQHRRASVMPANGQRLCGSGASPSPPHAPVHAASGHRPTPQPPHSAPAHIRPTGSHPSPSGPRSHDAGIQSGPDRKTRGEQGVPPPCSRRRTRGRAARQPRQSAAPGNDGHPARCCWPRLPEMRARLPSAPTTHAAPSPCRTSGTAPGPASPARSSPPSRHPSPARSGSCCSTQRRRRPPAAPAQWHTRTA